MFFFFFQAEDGIRDFCLSRGLGDVYKRQTQLSYVTNSNEGEGLLFYGNVIIPFVDRFPKNSLYKIMTTRPEETAEAG